MGRDGLDTFSTNDNSDLYFLISIWLRMLWSLFLFKLKFSSCKSALVASHSTLADTSLSLNLTMSLCPNPSRFFLQTIWEKKLFPIPCDPQLRFHLFKSCWEEQSTWWTNILGRQIIKNRRSNHMKMVLLTGKIPIFLAGQACQYWGWFSSGRFAARSVFGRAGSENSVGCYSDRCW